MKTATERFAERFKCVEDVAKTNVKEIEKVIKPAGLYKVRARRIKNVAKDLVEKYDGKIDKILNLPYEEAKKKTDNNKRNWTENRRCLFNGD